MRRTAGVSMLGVAAMSLLPPRSTGWWLLWQVVFVVLVVGGVVYFVRPDMPDRVGQPGHGSLLDDLGQWRRRR